MVKFFSAIFLSSIILILTVWVLFFLLTLSGASIKIAIFLLIMISTILGILFRNKINENMYHIRDWMNK